MTNQPHPTPDPNPPNRYRDELVRRRSEIARQSSPERNTFPPKSPPWPNFPNPAPRPRRPRRTACELLDALKKLVDERGEHVTLADFSRLAPISMSTLYTRFGKKKDIEHAYREFLSRREKRPLRATARSPSRPAESPIDFPAPSQ